MLNIVNEDYGALEQRVGLLMHIGRDLKRRGEAGFNIDVELKGTHIARQNISGQARYSAYLFLIEKELIEIADSKTYHDIEGNATFVKINLTEKGKEIYEKAESAYGNYLQELKDYFSDEL